MINTVHYVAQNKGGVGKSFIASLIAQYILHQQSPLHCYDLDPNNATFSKYKALSVERVNILKNKLFNYTEIDNMVENIINSTKNFVIDVGANPFLALCHYHEKNETISDFISEGKDVYFHSVITGTEIEDTTSGFITLLKSLPENAKVIVWHNGFFGESTLNGKHFNDFEIIQQYANRIHNSIIIDEDPLKMTSDAIQLVIKEHLTLSQASDYLKFSYAQRKRIGKIKRQIFKAIEKALD